MVIFMIFTVDNIKKRAIPIVVKYGVNTFSLFGSYSRGESNEDSDLDFAMDKGDLKGLQYVSLVQDLENEFNCHVDVISKAVQIRNFLKQ